MHSGPYLATLAKLIGHQYIWVKITCKFGFKNYEKALNSSLISVDFEMNQRYCQIQSMTYNRLKHKNSVYTK